MAHSEIVFLLGELSTTKVRRHDLLIFDSSNAVLRLWSDFMHSRFSIRFFAIELLYSAQRCRVESSFTMKRAARDEVVAKA
jgi:hypothetical protein